MGTSTTINLHGVAFSRKRRTTYLMFMHLLKNKTMIRKDLEHVVFKARKGLKYMGNDFQHHTREQRFKVTKEGRNAIYTLTSIGREYAKKNFGLTDDEAVAKVQDVANGVDGVNGAKKPAKPAKAPAKKAPVKKAPAKKEAPAKALTEALV